jgi:lauroyl/myristoyl acyltransferase
MLTSPPLIRAAVRALRVVPVGVMRGVARLAGNIGYWVAPTRRLTIIENVEHLAPDDSSSRRRRLARRTFVNLMEAAVDLFRLPTATREELLELVEIRGKEHLDAALALGRGVVTVTPHLGPYELGGAYLAAAGYTVHAMVEDIDPEVNAALALYREATGMKLLSRSRGLRAALRVLKDKEILLLVADRVIGDGSDGVEVPFANGRRAIPTGPASFALASGAPVIVGHIARNTHGGARYLIRLDPPILPESTGHSADDRLRLTTRIAERFSSLVREHPDQWFVFQPEWKRRDV